VRCPSVSSFTNDSPGQAHSPLITRPQPSLNSTIISTSGVYYRLTLFGTSGMRRLPASRFEYFWFQEESESSRLTSSCACSLSVRVSPFFCLDTQVRLAPQIRAGSWYWLVALVPPLEFAARVPDVSVAPGANFCLYSIAICFLARKGCDSHLGISHSPSVERTLPFEVTPPHPQ